MSKDKEYWVVLPFIDENSANLGLQNIRNTTAYRGIVTARELGMYNKEQGMHNNEPVIVLDDKLNCIRLHLAYLEGFLAAAETDQTPRAVKHIDSISTLLEEIKEASNASPN